MTAEERSGLRKLLDRAMRIDALIDEAASELGDLLSDLENACN